jgi:hypothetical protein
MSESEQEPAAIEFVDSDGVRWEVREIPAPVLREGSAVSAFGEYSQGWLLFASEHLKKRLTPFPEDWRTLTPYELEKWCWRARAERKTGSTSSQVPVYDAGNPPGAPRPGSG